MDASPRFSWSRALTAGAVATVVMTVFMMLTGMNLMKALGSMLVPSAGVAMQSIAGGVMHLAVGLFYGVVFAWLFGRVTEWGPFVKGAVYGLAITGIALAVMPLMAAMGGGGEAANPCAPAAAVANPCQEAAMNPCAAKNPCAANPCAPENPCAPKNPCAPTNPCAEQAAATNPCAAPASACRQAGPANPCNPCGGAGGGALAGLMSALNHLIYALVLAFVYGRGRG